MPIFYVSDLHLCDKGPRDRFHALGPERFHRFLDYVQKEKGRLIIGGDLLDFIECEASRAVMAYRRLLVELDEMGAQYIAGNHDGQLHDLLTLSHFTPAGNVKCKILGVLDRQRGPFVEVLPCGKRILFCHGHEADGYCNGPNPGIGEVTAIIQGILREQRGGKRYLNRLFGGDLFLSACEGLSWAWRVLTLRPTRYQEFVAGMHVRMKSWDAHAVVCGHWHVPGHIGSWYYNAGAWCTGTDTYVRIEDDGKIEVCEWET